MPQATPLWELWTVSHGVQAARWKLTSPKDVRNDLRVHTNKRMMLWSSHSFVPKRVSQRTRGIFSSELSVIRNIALYWINSNWNTCLTYSWWMGEWKTRWLFENCSSIWKKPTRQKQHTPSLREVKLGTGGGNKILLPNNLKDVRLLNAIVAVICVLND